MTSATPTGSTRERLLAEGMRLFAERGFTATTVGDIEAAAGLQPRRGALYRHFASKEALLDASIRQHITAMQAGRATLAALQSSDLRSEIVRLGYYVLEQLDVQRDITLVLEHDGHRVPDLRKLFRDEVSDVAYAATAEVLGRWTPGREDADLEADAVVLLGALVNLRRSAWTLAAPPLGVDDERVVAAWATMCLALIEDDR